MDTIHGGRDVSANWKNADDAQLRKELFSPFSSKDLFLPPVSLWQKLSTYVSGLSLVFLLACYIGLMLLMLWLTTDYLISHIRLMMAGESVGWYLALGILALIMVLLLIKPVFHVSQKPLEPLEITRHDQPLLYDYVDMLCKVLGTPPPARIMLTISPNASAGAKRLYSFSGAELEMTLGLTLVAALNVKQLTAVIAHELGHFARHANMRLGGLIRAINFWFARAIFEPDRFDLFLARSIQQYPILIVVFGPPRLVMKLGRKLLWVFLMLGGLASCMLSRLEEYRSDTYSARLSGSDASADTLQQLAILDLAENAVMNDVGGSWQEKRLPDDLPQMIVAKAVRLSPEGRKNILNAIRAERTGWMDFHPCLQDRIHAMKVMNTQGVVTCDKPARVLVNDFFQLCQKNSLDVYRYMLKEDFGKATIVPAEILIDEHAGHEKSNEALDRFYQCQAPMFRPIFIDEQSLEPPPGDFEQAKADCIAAREQMIASQKDLGETWIDLQNCRQKLYTLFELLTVVDAGFHINPQPHLGITDTKREYVVLRHKMAQKEMERIVRKLAPLESAARARMTCGLKLLHFEQVRQQAGVSIDDLRAELKAADAITRSIETLSETATNAQMLIAMLQLPWQRSSSKRKYDAAISGCGTLLHNLVEELTQKFSKAPYPYEHAKQDATLADYIIAQPSGASDYGSRAIMAIESLDRVDMITERLIARLAMATEGAEKAVGIEPQELRQEEDTSVPAPRAAARPLPGNSAAAAQVGISMAILIVALGIINGVKFVSPRFAVLPKHDDYRPTIISPNWTPPPRADVWNMGVHLYQPNSFQSYPYSPGGYNPSMNNSSDPWGRPADWKTRNDMPWNRSSSPSNTNHGPYYGPSYNNNRPGYNPSYPSQPRYEPSRSIRSHDGVGPSYPSAPSAPNPRPPNPTPGRP